MDKDPAKNGSANPHLDPALGPEQQIESSLLGEVMEYRAEAKFDAATDMAIRYVHGTEVDLGTALLAERSPKEIAESGGGWNDDNLTAPSHRRRFRAFESSLDMPPGALINGARNMPSQAEQVFPLGPGATLVVKKQGPIGSSRVSHRISVDNTVDAAKREASVSGFVDSAQSGLNEFNGSMEQIASAIERGELQAYGTTVNNFTENPDELMSFLDGGRGMMSLWESNPVVARQEVIEQIYSLPSHYSGDPSQVQRHEGIYFDEHGNVIKALVPTYTPGVYIALKSADVSQRGDLGEINLYPGIELYPEEIYAAEPDNNNTRYEDVVPFIETPAAAELLTLFGSGGLSITPRIKDSFAEVGDISTRFGHGYADLTREIAKLVNDRARPLAAFFAPDDALEQQIGALDSTDTTLSARIVIDLLKGVVSRSGQASDSIPELPLSSKRVELGNGSCKDIEVYIADEGNGVTNGEDGKPLMLKSAYKVPTFLTLRPVILNGVELPTGSLLLQEDDGYLFMRMTSMALSDEEAAVVFGAQDAENHQAPDFQNRVARVKSLSA